MNEKVEPSADQVLNFEAASESAAIRAWNRMLQNLRFIRDLWPADPLVGPKSVDHLWKNPTADDEAAKNHIQCVSAAKFKINSLCAICYFVSYLGGKISVNISGSFFVVDSSSSLLLYKLESSPKVKTQRAPIVAEMPAIW